jgi:hypothetical protein
VLIEINHTAMLGGLGIFGRESQFWSPVVHDDYRWRVELFTQRFDKPMACPGAMDRLDAESDLVDW